MCLNWKKIFSILLIVLFFGSNFIASYTFAAGHDIRHYDKHDYYTPHYKAHGAQVRSLPFGYKKLFVHGMEYFYWEGMFYRLMMGRYTVVPPPIGAVVNVVPQGASPVIVDGIAYYNINGITYMYNGRGYEVVPQPRLIVIKNYADGKVVSNNASAPGYLNNSNVQEDSFTVNVLNKQGSYTAVIVKRSGNGFVGPQGEYYNEFPKVEQLKVMYGG